MTTLAGLSQFKAAIFDMDGLLIDSEQLALSAFLTACSDFNLPDLTDVFIQCIGTNTQAGQEVLKNGLGDLIDQKLFGKRWGEHYHHLTEAQPVPVKEGVETLLSHLVSLGIPSAVATSTQTDKAINKLQRSKLLDYFEVIIGGDQVQQSKPKPDIYLQAAMSLSIKPTNCIAFEDSPNGVRAAIAAGMTTVQIPDLVQPNSELRDLGHIVLDKISDVILFEF